MFSFVSYLVAVFVFLGKFRRKWLWIPTIILGIYLFWVFLTWNKVPTVEDKIEIIYNEVDGTQNKRNIHPLYFFEYKKMKYITAYCELRNDIRHFELKRINIIKQ